MQDIAEKFGYKPYRGPSGPDEQQLAANNEALRQVCLDRLNLDSEIVDKGDYEVVEFGFLDDLQIGYDRWGFCDEQGKLDQATFKETFEFIEAALEAA